MDKLYEFRDGKVKEHLGSVSDFLEKRKIESLQELERLAPAAPKPVAEEKAVSKQVFERQRTANREYRKMQNRVSFLEKEIARLEAAQAGIEKVLANPGEKDDILELTRNYLENKLSLDSMTDEWGALLEKLEM